MLKRLGRVGDAMLARLVPRTTADAAYCWTFCSGYCNYEYNIGRTKRTCCTTYSCTTTNVRCGC